MKKSWLSQPSSVPKRKKKQTPNKQDSPIIMQEKLWTPPIDPFFQRLYARTWKRTKNQLWIKNFTTRQFLNKTFRPAYFWNKSVQIVRFWIQKRTRQLLNWNLNKASDFEIKVFQLTGFSKKLHSKNHVSVRFAPWKSYFFQAFRKASFWVENFTTCQISK